MIRLLKIELQKYITYRAFWLMIFFYFLLLATMIFGIPGLIDYIAEKSGEPTKFRIFKAIVFNFPDIWQNITYVASARFFIKIVLGIIIIILVTNEFQFLTIRSNIISGLDKRDFIVAKIQLIILLSLLSTLVIFFSGLYLGFSNSNAKSLTDVFGKLIFLLAYFIEIFSYLTFCLLLSIVFKKTGITFIAHFIYFIAEPILDFKLNDKITPYLPINAINGIIKSPNTSLIKIKSPDFNYEFQEVLALPDVAVCLLYSAIFIYISYVILRKRDI